MSNGRQQRSKRHPLVWLVAGGLAVFLLSYFSINADVGSDPKLTLLVSQALVDHHTVTLDAYRADVILDHPFSDYVAEGTILETNGHTTYYFPAGPALLSAPVVALLRSAGWDMRSTDNYRLQELLSALTATLAFFLAYTLARRFVPARAALVITLVSVLGSNLLSTLGTALWSHNYAVLFIAGGLWLLAGDRRLTPARSLLLGVLLFLAFLCRATAAAFIVPALAYLALRQRRALLPAAAAALALLLAYLLWHQNVYGAWLPSYYSPQRLAVERAPLWVGIAGNLLSPGRGIFVFSPFLLVVLAGGAAHRRDLRPRALVGLCAVWFALHLVLVARAASWWGGWSFGPRLLTDLWPGLILLTAIVWAAVTRRATPRRARLWAAAYLGLALPALFFHAGLGLNSQAASRWNGAIDPVPEPGSHTLGDLFDWRISQVAASNAMLCRLAGNAWQRAGLPPESLAPYRMGQRIAPTADQTTRWTPAGAPAVPAIVPSARGRAFLPAVVGPGALVRFTGWAPLAGGDFRWSQCPQAAVYFRLEERPAAAWLTLAVEGMTLGRQQVRYTLNGTLLGSSQWAGDEDETQSVRLASDLLRPNAINVLTFDFPDARSPSRRDQRPLGLALRSLAFHVTTPPPTPPPAPYPAP